MADCIISDQCGTPEELATLRAAAKNEPYWHYAGMIGDTGDYYAVNQFMFTFGVLSGPLETIREQYEHRWCYHGVMDAVGAVEDWRARDWQGEPEGWHRHAPSHRRRPNGDRSREYVCP